MTMETILSLKARSYTAQPRNTVLVREGESWLHLDRLLSFRPPPLGRSGAAEDQGAGASVPEAGAGSSTTAEVLLNHISETEMEDIVRALHSQGRMQVGSVSPVRASPCTSY